MPIPDMPSTLHVYYYADDLLPSYQGTIQGRIVPCVFVGSKPVSAAAITWHTHWLDTDVGNIIPTGFTHPAGVPTSLSYAYDPSRAAVLIWCRPDSEPWIFVALTSEVRYADTADEYRRIWLHKVDPHNILFETPC